MATNQLSNNMANAMFLQKKYSADPSKQYERSLVQISPHANVATPTNNDGVRLAQSLGVLSDTVGTFAKDEEDRKKTMGAKIAEDVAAGKTDQDWRTRTSIQMMNEYGKTAGFNVADNPYAMALLEKTRGKYFSAQFDGEYKIFAQQDTNKPRNAAEEAARYQKFMNEKFASVSAIADNQEAFNEGYFDNFIPQTSNHVNTFLKQQSDDLKTHGIAGYSAQLGNVALNYSTMSDDEKLGVFQDVINKGAVALDLDSVYDIVGNGAVEHSKRSGDTAFVSKVWNLKVPQPDGTTKPLGECIDLNHAVDVAEVSSRIHWSKDMDDMVQKLEKGTVQNVHDTFTKLEKENPHLFQSLLPMKDNILQHIRTEEEKKKKADLKNMVASGNYEASKRYVTGMIGNYMKGALTDSNNQPIPQTTGDFAGRLTGADGKPVTIPQQVINECIANEIAYYRNSMPPQAANEATMKLLKWGASSDYVSSVKTQITTDISTAKPGATSFPKNAEVGLSMYHSSPGLFEDIFGNDTARDMQMLSVLSDGLTNPGKGLELMAASKANLKDDKIMEPINKALKPKYESGAIEGVTAMDGKGSTVTLNAGNNWDVRDRVYRTAQAYAATGRYSTDEAWTLATQNVKDNYWVYQDTAIPKALFASFNVADKATNGCWVLDDKINDFITENPAVGRASISVDYDENTGLFTVTGGGVSKTWTKAQLVDYGNRNAAAWNSEHANSNVDVNDVNAQRGAAYEKRTEAFYNNNTRW